jgi:hypothetical protein
LRDNNDCGIEQPLESTLEALSAGTNPGFLRSESDPPSLLAIVFLSEEDDCSAHDQSYLRPPHLLDPSVPWDAELAQQGLETRCHHNPDSLFPLSRYIEGFAALRPGRPDLVVFTAIAGVPIETAQPVPDTFATDAAARSTYYQGIRSHPLMQPLVETMRTADPQDDELRPSCNTTIGVTTPPWRIVDVAEAFGPNGMVQSICQQDLGPALDAIVDRIVHHFALRAP